MPGTKEGSKKAVAKIRARYGDDFFKNIGAKGGRNGKGPDYTGGFASLVKGPDGLTGRERASFVGAIGGFKSRRGKAKKNNGAN